MDQLSAMRAFVRVVQTGSFSITSREMNTTQSTISKNVAALEVKIGVKLLTRNSREHALTLAGTDFYNTCVTILNQLDEAESKARLDISSPQGMLRISAPIVFGRLILAPLIAEFFTLYPKIKVDLSLSDRHVDLIRDGIDVAIRSRVLEDSSLVARYLFDNPMLLLASPNYLASNGEPREPEDLKQHNCLVYTRLKSVNVWHFEYKNKKTSVPISGSFQSDNGDVLLEAALAHIGLVQLPIWMASEHIQSGRLKKVMTKYSGQNLTFNAIYTKSRYTPHKVHCFVDFLRKKLFDIDI